MHEGQRSVLVLVAMALLLATLVPPWELHTVVRGNHVVTDGGFAFLLAPPDAPGDLNVVTIARVHYGRLALIWIVIGLLGAAAVIHRGGRGLGLGSRILGGFGLRWVQRIRELRRSNRALSAERDSAHGANRALRARVEKLQSRLSELGACEAPSGPAATPGAQRPNARQLERAREIIRDNVREPCPAGDPLLGDAEELLRRRGMKYDERTVVIAVLHHRRRDSGEEARFIVTEESAYQQAGELLWEISVAWSHQEAIDLEQATHIARLFLKANEMEEIEFEVSDDRPALKIFAPYLPGDDERDAYRRLTGS